jgi:DNA-binding transcriptional LysR family regulator
VPGVARTHRLVRGELVTSDGVADLTQALGPTAVGEQPVVADAHQALGEHVQQEAADELSALEPQGLAFTVAMVGVAKPHPLSLDTDEAPLGEARALYDQVERVYGGLYELERFAEDLKATTRGRLLVGALPILSNRWLPWAVSRFLRHRDDVTVSLQTRRSLRIAEWVAGRQVDVGIAMLSRHYPGVEQELLAGLELVCVMPRDHRLTRKSQITPRDIAGESFIRLSSFDRARSVIDRALDDTNIEPRRRVDTFMASVACAMVLEGVGISIVDAVTASEQLAAGIVARPFRPRLTFDVMLIRPVGSPHSQLVDAFLEALRRDARRSRLGEPPTGMFREAVRRSEARRLA